MKEAASLWKMLASQTNVDIGLVTGGVTYLARDEAALARYADWLPYAADLDIDTRLLSLTETEELNVLSYEYFYNGGGVAVGDVNNDGIQDQVVTQTDLDGNFEISFRWCSGSIRRRSTTLLPLSCAMRPA